MAQLQFQIRWHLFTLACLILLPQIALGAYVAYTYAEDARVAVERSTETLAESILQATDREVLGVIGVLQGLATAITLRHRDFETFYQQATAASAGRPIRGVALRDQHGNHLVNTNVPWGSDLPAPNDVALRFDRDLFAARAPRVSELHTGRVSREQLILVGVPVFFDDQARFTLSAGLRPALMAGVLSRHCVTEGWLCTVVDDGGRIIARSRDQARYVGRSASGDFLSQLTVGAGRIDSTTLDGAEASTTYVRSGLSGWTVVVSVPRPLLEAPVNALWRSLLALGALGLCTSSVAGALYARAIGGSLKRLAFAAARTGRGEPITPVRSSISEIADAHDALAMAADELTRRANHKTMLMAELDHRVKNTLAVIQTLVGRSMHAAASPEQAREALRGRVMALASAHEVLSEAGWEPVGLEQLVRAIAEADCINIDACGPAIRLEPKAVVALAQTMHELAKNAIQHGALSQADGSVELRWWVENELVVWRWCERAFTHAPMTGAGFGTQIIRLCIERQLGGAGTFHVADDKFCYEARIPLVSPVLGRIARLDDEEAERVKAAEPQA